MSVEINVAFVQQFEDNVRHLSQQQGSRLENTVTNKTVVGKYHHFERIGATAASKRTTRHSDTPIVDVPHSRRRVILEDYEWGELVDSQDEIRLLINPTSEYARSAAWSLGRAKDDVVIAAATGNAISVSATDTTSNVALPAGQIVDEDFGTGTDTNLTLEKLIEARRILLKNDVDERERFYFIYNASAQANLLNDSTLTSADYNTVRSLVAGEIDSFVGFEFIRTERLLGVADGTDTDPVKCLAYTETGIGLAVGQDMTVKMAEDPTKAFAMRIYASQSINATRIEDEKVVEVQCVQSA